MPLNSDLNPPFWPPPFPSPSVLGAKVGLLNSPLSEWPSPIFTRLFLECQCESVSWGGVGVRQTAPGLIVQRGRSLRRLISRQSQGRSRPSGKDQVPWRASCTADPEGWRRPVKGLARKVPRAGGCGPVTGGKWPAGGQDCWARDCGGGTGAEQGGAPPAPCTQTLPQSPCLDVQPRVGFSSRLPSLEAGWAPSWPPVHPPPFSAPRAPVEATLLSACAVGFPASPCLTTLFWGRGPRFPSWSHHPAWGGCPMQGTGCEDRNPAALGRGWVADG